MRSGEDNIGVNWGLTSRKADPDGPGRFSLQHIRNCDSVGAHWRGMPYCGRGYVQRTRAQYEDDVEKPPEEACPDNGNEDRRGSCDQAVGGQLESESEPRLTPTCVRSALYLLSGYADERFRPITTETFKTLTYEMCAVAS